MSEISRTRSAAALLLPTLYIRRFMGEIGSAALSKIFLPARPKRRNIGTPARGTKVLRSDTIFLIMGRSLLHGSH